MQTDCYTKAVLTVIATALVCIAAQNAVHGAKAQMDGPQRVQICDPVGNCAGLAAQTVMGVRLNSLRVSIRD